MRIITKLMLLLAIAVLSLSATACCCFDSDDSLSPGIHDEGGGGTT